jgi:hypothetical protein
VLALIIGLKRDVWRPDIHARLPDIHARDQPPEASITIIPIQVLEIDESRPLTPEKSNGGDKNEINDNNPAQETTKKDKSSSKNRNNKELCVICWDNKADHVFIPCGHLCICASCSRKAEYLGCCYKKCPVCQQSYERAMRVYHTGVVRPGGNKKNCGCRVVKQKTWSDEYIIKPCLLYSSFSLLQRGRSDISRFCQRCRLQLLPDFA